MTDDGAAPTFEYFECPKCGARYLPARPLPVTDEPRWFYCHRCQERVVSATSPKRKEGEQQLA